MPSPPGDEPRKMFPIEERGVRGPWAKVKCAVVGNIGSSLVQSSLLCLTGICQNRRRRGVTNGPANVLEQATIRLPHLGLGLYSNRS
jgi:hypothetical protein